MKKSAKSAVVAVPAPVVSADVHGIAIRVVKVADKCGLRPADIMVASSKLTAAGIDPATVTADVISEATRIDRRESAALLERAADINAKVAARKQPAPTQATVISSVVVDQKPAKTKQPAVEHEAKVRVKIMGFAVTAVLRWMGAKNWNFEDAATAITTLGATDISDVTIRLQLKAGKDGTRGPAAEITSAQAKKLKSAAQ